MKPLILHVEDDYLLKKMYGKEFEMSGYTYVSAANGEEGLNLAKLRSPDLIITDAVMPVLDGFSMLKLLKSHKKTKHIPVLMLSSHSRQGYIDQALELGAVNYFVKSNVVPRDVVNHVQKLLQLQSRPASAAN